MKLAWLNEKKCSTTPAAPGRRIIITFHSALSLLAALGGIQIHTKQTLLSFVLFVVEEAKCVKNSGHVFVAHGAGGPASDRSPPGQACEHGFSLDPSAYRQAKH